MPEVAADMNVYAGYDRQAQENGWYPEALFGLTYEYLRPDDRLLDVGIGTGLGSEPYARAGLTVSGFDPDKDMLAICRAKGFAELKEHDLLALPWPYADAAFDHVVSFGVLHFIRDAGPAFRETSRVLRPGGSFTFTTKEPPAGSAAPVDPSRPLEETIQGTTLYLHNEAYLEDFLAASGFDLCKKLRLLVRTGRGTDDVFCARVALRR